MNLDATTILFLCDYMECSDAVAALHSFLKTYDVIFIFILEIQIIYIFIL